MVKGNRHTTTLGGGKTDKIAREVEIVQPPESRVGVKVVAQELAVQEIGLMFNGQKRDIFGVGVAPGCIIGVDPGYVGAVLAAITSVNPGDGP